MDECCHRFSADKLLVTCSCVQCVNCRLNLTLTSVSNLSPCLLYIVAYLSCDHFSNFCLTRGKIASFCLVRQNRQYQLYWLMCIWLSSFRFGLDIGVNNFIFSDMDWVWSRWKSFGFDQDCKISISVHHCFIRESGSNRTCAIGHKCEKLVFAWEIKCKDWGHINQICWEL